MLLSLQIENFALIDRLELDFGSGLHVLTGETGAGKSIILDAIDAALGGKVTNRAVRTGAERASVEATFQLDSAMKNWLETEQIDPLDGSLLVCTREIVASGSGQRNRSRVNGVLVNKQQMESLRDRLVEITAQGQTVQLGQPSLQRDWLDSFGGTAIVKQREAVSQALSSYQQAAQALEKRRHSEQQRLQQLDLFEYQLRELNVANLSQPDELDQLEQERKRLGHSVELQQQSYQAYQALYQNENGDDACSDLLGKAQTLLTDMLRYDEQIQPVLDLVTSALTQVEEAGQEINAYGDSLETDPRRLQEVEERIIELKQICRKYGPSLADAIALQQSLQAELEGLTGAGQSLEELEQAAYDRKTELTDVCAKLTHLRQTAAKDLENRLIAELKPLAMEKVQFQVGITSISPTSAGADRITYLFSPNPGEPLQSLTETASGGEMSRFLLALQACFSQVDSVGTLVFDEIDVGVSGRVAQAIAEKLHHLSRHHQVLCVTHQPIVAAMADHHFHVDKQVIDFNHNGHAKGKKRKTKADAEEDGVVADTPDVRTVVRVSALDRQQRREELAQLAGGQSNDSTNGSSEDAASAFAESLLAQAASLRENGLVQVDHPASEPVRKPRSTKAKAAKKN
ncbi:DNA repair protein RecN [Phormidesmis priestleyi ULC007]|uniref:DNA repair protein RecN n=1 Tax=Phormidesmis priestleyi ULC007 TaxID=1920490 RepID=A0A2T1DEZ1_9CYAN|nr:DNA repair protein RecN [Phormidesmis priestleyi]PSB19090.1 DNA repair protein RecN [Phormidesmis priestleyi ULC007]PZO49942.1 MAG: DNA repair protein RecN [Phormidesmis priestleyi]